MHESEYNGTLKFSLKTRKVSTVIFLDIFVTVTVNRGCRLKAMCTCDEHLLGLLRYPVHHGNRQGFTPGILSWSPYTELSCRLIFSCAI